MNTNYLNEIIRIDKYTFIEWKNATSEKSLKTNVISIVITINNARKIANRKSYKRLLYNFLMSHNLL